MSILAEMLGGHYVAQVANAKVGRADFAVYRTDPTFCGEDEQVLPERAERFV